MAHGLRGHGDGADDPLPPVSAVREWVRGIGDLAKAVGHDPSYVGRTLNLTLLAPGIIEAILAGREPSGLSLERLVRTLPDAWEEQRHVLGFEKG